MPPCLLSTNYAALELLTMFPRFCFLLSVFCHETSSEADVFLMTFGTHGIFTKSQDVIDREIGSVGLAGHFRWHASPRVFVSRNPKDYVFTADEQRTEAALEGRRKKLFSFRDAAVKKVREALPKSSLRHLLEHEVSEFVMSREPLIVRNEELTENAYTVPYQVDDATPAFRRLLNRQDEVEAWEKNDFVVNEIVCYSLRQIEVQISSPSFFESLACSAQNSSTLNEPRFSRTDATISLRLDAEKTLWWRSLSTRNFFHRLLTRYPSPHRSNPYLVPVYWAKVVALRETVLRFLPATRNAYLLALDPTKHAHAGVSNAASTERELMAGVAYDTDSVAGGPEVSSFFGDFARSDLDALVRMGKENTEGRLGGSVPGVRLPVSVQWEFGSKHFSSVLQRNFFDKKELLQRFWTETKQRSFLKLPSGEGNMREPRAAFLRAFMDARIRSPSYTEEHAVAPSFTEEHAVELSAVHLLPRNASEALSAGDREVLHGLSRVLLDRLFFSTSDDLLLSSDSADDFLGAADTFRTTCIDSELRAFSRGVGAFAEDISAFKNTPTFPDASETLFIGRGGSTFESRIDRLALRAYMINFNRTVEETIEADRTVEETLEEDRDLLLFLRRVSGRCRWYFKSAAPVTQCTWHLWQQGRGTDAFLGQYFSHVQHLETVMAVPMPEQSVFGHVLRAFGAKTAVFPSAYADLGNCPLKKNFESKEKCVPDAAKSLRYLVGLGNRVKHLGSLVKDLRTSNGAFIESFWEPTKQDMSELTLGKKLHSVLLDKAF